MPGRALRAPTDRRRKRLRYMNYATLPTCDLIARIAGESQAHLLMERYGTLTALARADEQELMDVPGVGQAKAAAVKSALSLALKLSEEAAPEAKLLDTPERAADLLREETRIQPVETFYVILLNTRRRLIKKVLISQGTLDTILVSPREIFYPAIIHRSAAILLAHSHPSSDPTPSEADIRVTRDLIRAGQLLKIEVLDHIIMGLRSTERPRDFVSLRELGFFS